MAANLQTELPLLRTKLSIPRFPADFVPRPRLTERITRGAGGPLTLVTAPAGFGKTHVLAEWAAQSVGAIGWLTLDSEDNDLVRFFRYLTGACQEAVPRLGQETWEFIQSTQGSNPQAALTPLINEFASLPQDVTLVLDDFHAVENPEILRSLDFLLRHLPRGLHLLLAGRSEPALDFAYLRARGQVVELGAQHLRFTGDEVAQFFRQTMGLALPPQTVTALAERTEGWITALQLAAIALRDQPEAAGSLAGFQGDARYLVDFLAAEVLDRQAEPVRVFLLHSAVLDRLSGPLCEAVAAPDAPPGYGAEMLERLQRARLFVAPLDEKHEWFRFHPLFAEFLRHVLAQTSADEKPELHRRAAAWFEAHGELDSAFKHALASGDARRAADLVERNVEPLLLAGEILTVNRWIGELPRELVLQSLILSLAYAWSLIAACHLDDARFWLDHVEQVLSSAEQPPREEDRDRLWEIQGGLAVSRSMLALLGGDLQASAHYTQVATSYLRADNPFLHGMIALEDSLYFSLAGDTTKAIEMLHGTTQIAMRTNDVLVLVAATCKLAEMQAMRGQLSRALTTLQRAQAIAQRPGVSGLPLIGIVDNALGELLRERDLLPEARERLERGCQLTRAWWSLSSLEGTMTLARVRQSLGDAAGAQALLTEAYQLVMSSEPNQGQEVLVASTGARLALGRGDLATAAHWLRQSGLLDEGDRFRDLPYRVAEWVLLTRARYDFAAGQSAGETARMSGALSRLESLLPEADAFKRVSSKIEILVLQALIESALGQTDQAVRTLLGALALGEPEDYRRVFLDEGRPMAELLARCRTARRIPGEDLPTPGYIESLLEALGPEGGDELIAAAAETLETPVRPVRTRTEDGLPLQLSAREMQVLALVAEGKSNQEIAAELYLTLNTAKRHVYNIFAKLDVKKRTHAVARARQLGLLP